MTNDPKIEAELLNILRDYEHYKCMTAGFFSSLTQNHGMSFHDFIQYLKSRE